MTKSASIYGASHHLMTQKGELCFDLILGAIATVVSKFVVGPANTETVLAFSEAGQTREHIPKQLNSLRNAWLTANEANEVRRCHFTIIAGNADPIIPIRKNACLWREACTAAQIRNETLRANRPYGRALWKRLTGFHAKGWIEANVRRLKAFGERISESGKTAEIRIRSAKIVRITKVHRAKGSSGLESEFCNNPN